MTWIVFMVYVVIDIICHMVSGCGFQPSYLTWILLAASVVTDLSTIFKK